MFSPWVGKIPWRSGRLLLVVNLLRRQMTTVAQGGLAGFLPSPFVILLSKAHTEARNFSTAQWLL